MPRRKCQEDEETHLRLQAARAEPLFEPSGPLPGKRHQNALENALTLEQPEDRRTSTAVAR